MQKLKAETMVNSYTPGQLTEWLLKAMMDDYGLHIEQAQIIIRKAMSHCKKTNMSNNGVTWIQPENVYLFLDIARDLAEFFVTTTNEGAYQWGRLPEYQNIIIKSSGEYLNILVRTESNPDAKIDPQTRLIANIKSAVQAQVKGQKNRRSQFTWADIDTLDKNIQARYGFQIVSKQTMKVRNENENLLAE